MSEWNGITEVEGWSKKLGSLLKEARQVAQDGDLQKRLTLNERLMQFIGHSYPNTPEIRSLDDVASQTATALMLGTIENRLAAISERTAIYQKVKKEFKAQAEGNKAKADSIRLKGATVLIDAASRTIESAKALRASLTDKAADNQLRKRIDDAVKAIETLRKSAAKIF